MSLPLNPGAASQAGPGAMTDRDRIWLTRARRLQRGVKVGLALCLVVAGVSAWQLVEALRWNSRLVLLAQELAGPEGGGTGVMPSGEPQAASGTTGQVANARAATVASATVAASVAANVAASVAAPAMSAAGERGAARRTDRSGGLTGAAATAWADDAASAASAAAQAASTAADLPGQPGWLTDGSPPPWRFAQGMKLARAGDLDAALARYRSVFDDAALGNAARFNSANTLLREAVRLSATAAPGQALVMFELAKEGYRGVLRRDPSFWAARYNLERALLLQPDGVAVAAEPAQQAERAATTMRSVSRGLP